MKMMKLFLVGCMVSGLSSTGYANNDKYKIPPKNISMPCEQPFKLAELSKLVIHMTPFRGVNLVFPYQLDEDKTTVTLSSKNTWHITPHNNSELLTVTFSKFNENWGELQDLTIKTENHMVSIGLVADPNIKNHCSNIVFTLTPEEIERIRNKKKEAYKRELDQQFQDRMAKLDEEVNNKSLALVGALSLGDKDSDRIKEASILELPNGDEVEVYVDEIRYFQQFTVIKAEVENNSDIQSIYINEIKLTKDPSAEEIQGYVEYTNKLKPGEVKELLFVTLSEVPGSGAAMKVKTDKGIVEVKW